MRKNKKFKKKSNARKLKEKLRKKNQGEACYLETSIQIKRIYGHPEEKKIIEQVTTSKRKFVSSFIYREYQRRIIIPLIDFCFALSGEDNVENAVDYMSNKVRSLRDAKILLKIAFNVGSKYSDNKKGALSYIRFLISESSRLFMRDVNRSVPNLIGMDWIKVPSTNADEEELLAFKKSIICSGNCGQNQLWQSHVSELDAFLDPKLLDQFKPRSDYDGFFSNLTLFEEIKGNAALSDRYRKCLKLGDAVVAVECPMNSLLITTDIAFEVYVAALGKRQHRIPSLIEIRKQYHPH